MSDFPSNTSLGNLQTLSSFGLESLAGDACISGGGNYSGSAVWPAANRALYIPVMVEQVVTAYQMSFVVGTQSGNFDIGIYNVNGVRLVSKGSTAVPAAGLAKVDITDTLLIPGIYFLALNVDNVTAAVNRMSTFGTAGLQICGVQQQAVGAVALPATATFAAPASAYVPALVAHLQSVV